MKRSLNKKIFQEFWKKELESPNLIYLLVGVESTPQLQLFFEPDNLDLYPDDIDQFFLELSKSFQNLSKIRGKKKDSDSALAELLSKRNFILLDPNSDNGKRKRDEEKETQTGKISRRELSTREKAVFREIAREIISHPRATPFLYPVDKEQYPDYYDLICSPMDLTSWKSKLSQYRSINEALDDLRLIWKNCLLYNLEDSEISLAALELAKFSESLVQERIGPEYCDASFLNDRRKALKRKIQKDESSVVDGDLAFMTTLLERLMKHDLSQPFIKPVSDRDAPGYSSIIQKPMDLSTIEKKLQSKKYHSVADFIGDVHLIWQNCIEYNDPNSAIVKSANDLKDFFELTLLQNRKPPSNDLSMKLLGILSSLRSFTPFVDPFVLPVSEVDAPGYSKVVMRPMCLSVIEEKVKSKEYDSSIGKFFQDVQLIWDNCRVYNLPDSDIYKWSEKCESLFRSLVNDSKQLSAAFKKSKQAPLEINDEKTLPTAVDNKNRVKTAITEKQYRKILESLSADSEISETFTTSSSDKSISNGKLCYPKLLEEVKGFLDDPLEFLRFFSSLLSSAASVSSLTEKKCQLILSKLLALFRAEFPNCSVDSVLKEKGKFLTNVKTSPNQILEKKEILESIKRSFIQDGNTASLLRSGRFEMEYAQRKAAELMKLTKVPYPIKSNLIEVVDFGVIEVHPCFHSSHNLYPINFTTRTILRFMLFNASIKKTYSVPFVEIPVYSMISRSNDSRIQPQFVLKLENGVELSRGDTPISAWKGIRGKESAMIKLMTSKLKRCRAVLNRLSISPDIEPFLEEIPRDSSIGADYYRIITSPMWLREVHTRLCQGFYDNEFDFAWDMRLIFRNCMSYNIPESSLYAAAERLSAVFEVLLSDWVYNIQDCSVDEFAEGPWDDWYYLKYFDSVNEPENFCRLTGKTGKASDFYCCKVCKDQFLPASIGFSQRPSRNSSWLCKRCEEASALCSGDLKAPPLPSCSESKYCASEFKRNVFVPATDIGLGWFQARKKGRSGLKNVFLSPLGYEVHSKDDVLLQKEFEEVIDKELLAARAKEWKDSHLHIRGSGKRKRASGRGVEISSGAQIDEDLKTLFEPRHLEDSRVIYGKLVELVLPAELSWICCVPNLSDSAEASSYREFSLESESESSTDFFCLDLEDVRLRLEGLENASGCTGYQFLTATKIKEEIEREYEEVQKRQEKFEIAVRNIFSLLIKQRWEKKMNNEQKILETISTEEIDLNFKRLSQGFTDNLFVIWDCLATSFTATDLNVSFAELMVCVNPPPSILPTISQSLFDEICAAFTQLLQDEVVGDNKYDFDWQGYLMTHLVNCITWPKHLESLLLVSSLPLTKDQTALLLFSSLDGEALLQLKALTLLFNHPLISHVQEALCSDNFLMETLERTILSAADRKMGFAECSRESFLEFSERFFRRLEESDAREECKAVAKWFRCLLVRIGYISTEEASSGNDDYDGLSARNWGGISSRATNVDELGLHPFSFETTLPSKYQVMMKYLLCLERSFSLLSCSDPESWSAQDRVFVLLTVVDYVKATSWYRSVQQGLLPQKQLQHETLTVEEIQPFLASSQSSGSTKLHISKGTRCVFSGILFEDFPFVDQWCIVPSELLASLDLPDGQNFETGSYSFRQSIFGLKSVLESLNICRENRRKDDIELEMFRTDAVRAVQSGRWNDIPPVPTSSQISNNSQLIGRDVSGNSLWLFSAQQIFTLFPFDSNGKIFGFDRLELREPCVLLRSFEAAWFYLDANRLPALLELLSRSDKETSLVLLERYLHSKTSLLSGTLALSPQQKIWFDRKSYIEKWASTVSLYTGPSDSHRSRQLEAQFARCNEARMCVFYSKFFKMMNKSGAEDSIKKAKDYLLEGILDCSPSLGWINDGLKRLSCSSIATRIHSDPTIATAIVQNLSKCEQLKKCKVIGESVSVAETQPTIQEEMYGGEGLTRSLDEYIEHRLREVGGTTSTSRAILQLHPLTKRILRIYSSGKEAAQAMNISQSGLLLSVNGSKETCAGFRWKWYEGTPIEYDLIQHLQTPISELLLLQERGFEVSNNQPSSTGDQSIKASLPPALPMDTSSFAFPSHAQPRLQHHIVTSTKTTSSKLIKLKSELFNILYAFPEKALKWPELDASSESMIQTAGETAFNNVMSASASILAVAQNSGQPVDINKMAEKASRKARRRLRRKLAVEIFTKAVQAAASPSDLLVQVNVLEAAIPLALMFSCNRICLPNTAHTSAEVAMRLFALDRSIAYDEIHFIENAANVAPSKLRVCYSSRCHLSGQCTRYLGHAGKCSMGAASFSRLPDQFQIAPPNEVAQHSSAIAASSNRTNPSMLPHSLPRHAPPRTMEEYLPKLSTFNEKDDVDIEMINPWFPPSTEISGAMWL